ncbi:nucleotidyl transferase AbiEii/AbiGii toxin family protein [Collinsella ureilytica]|uniref:nucleotidyl transferase AbiEii/AbiGii toxin family protein n=1 Tax=Collinsella ureilytica TaxID=2869515 RepID=UPI0027D20416|nr:nucleotidyl transferase AbiEii/AbiGii toxin family protein [Collinsella urealyticum]
MDRIARASTDERRLVFESAAQRMALAPAVVEKDFWVCYALDHLFKKSGFVKSMVFKGGTSLSKAFGLIECFSEDIDLVLDWRLLGYSADELWEPCGDFLAESEVSMLTVSFAVQPALLSA